MISFTAVSTTQLPFPDDYFDIVVSWTVLMHIRSKKFDRAVSEIKRVRSDEGQVILCEGVQYPRNSDTPSSGLRDSENGHVWDRSVEEYATAFAPLGLTHSSFINEYEQFSGRKEKSG
jgi:ubiquinone/menaquinone biosynthesis C-methylase UbiE